MNEGPPPRSRLPHETTTIVITIISVGIALAGLMLVITGDIREEARADRAASLARDETDRAAALARDEADRAAALARDEAARAAWQAESRQLRDEATADREQFRQTMDAFRLEMQRLAERQSRIEGPLEPPVRSDN